MSAIPLGPITPEEYLARERAATVKSEYYRRKVFCTAGATFGHSLIKDNLAGEVGNQLKHERFRVVTSDLRVKVPAIEFYAYPDIVIVCEDPKFKDKYCDTLLNPLVLVEVFSDSTENYDRGLKFQNYREIASLREYVLVSQEAAQLERYVRQGEGNWLLTPFVGLEATLEFASVPARVSLAKIYRGVTFPAPARAATNDRPQT